MYGQNPGSDMLLQSGCCMLTVQGTACAGGDLLWRAFLRRRAGEHHSHVCLAVELRERPLRSVECVLSDVVARHDLENQTIEATNRSTDHTKKKGLWRRSWHKLEALKRNPRLSVPPLLLRPCSEKGIVGDAGAFG